MYDFTGCECPVCHTAFFENDDRVVCPDCGTPYHRSCYEQVGHCLHAKKHGTGFEWAPPKQPEPAVACARCGAANEAGSEQCKACGFPLNAPAGGNAPHRPQAEHAAPDSNFDYQTIYRNAAAIDPNETLDGIPAAEWASFIGRSSYTYLRVFKRMELSQRKTALSLSAMLFSPFYFFYRKAWTPAFVSLIVWLLLETPSVMWALKLSESALTAGISLALLEVLVNVSSVLLMAFRLTCGLFGFYMYRKYSAARIQRIRKKFADPQRRTFELAVQGGSSWAAVILAFGVYVVYSMVFAGLAGPNWEALYSLLGW